MASIASVSHRPAIFGAVLGFFSAIGHALVTIAENNPRYRELERLQRLSDAELAARGLTRERLVEHVFRAGIAV